MAAWHTGCKPQAALKLANNVHFLVDKLKHREIIVGAVRPGCGASPSTAHCSGSSSKLMTGSGLLAVKLDGEPAMMSKCRFDAGDFGNGPAGLIEIALDKRSMCMGLTIIIHDTVYRNNVERFVIQRLNAGVMFEPHGPQYCLRRERSGAIPRNKVTKD
ncbi:hypothetical protein BDZ45DRAFT_732387 [Acephala macrosclerotiorum]|nr:hypothetical protein BDZ45DRAFT_732387 [Acephala macrosclerotiorum]